MTDLGRTMDSQAIESTKKGEKIYPSITIPLEALKDKDVGDMCRLEVTAKITGKQENKDYKDLTLELHSMEYLGKAGKITKDEYLSKNEDERDEYDKKQLEEKNSKKEEDEGEE